jgi:hypothetical protein
MTAFALHLLSGSRESTTRCNIVSHAVWNARTSASGPRIKNAWRLRIDRTEQQGVTLRSGANPQHKEELSGAISSTACNRARIHCALQSKRQSTELLRMSQPPTDLKQHVQWELSVSLRIGTASVTESSCR